MQEQSDKGLDIYKNRQADMRRELELISTGDKTDVFYKQAQEQKEYHTRNPGAPVEDLAKRYRTLTKGGRSLTGNIASMFSGEEAYGRFFDLTLLHEEFLNLPGIKAPGVKKLNYVQYIDNFDKFNSPAYQMTKRDKKTNDYLSYLRSLSHYLDSFLRRTKPLEEIDPVLNNFDKLFDIAWNEDKVEGWEDKPTETSGGVAEGNGEGTWCADCQKTFTNPNVYKHHLTAKKHLKNVEIRKAGGNGDNDTEITDSAAAPSSVSIKRAAERGIAYLEFKIQKVAGLLETERADTRGNVERKAGLTDRERDAERRALYELDEEDMLQAANGANGDDNAEGGEENEDGTVYNPLNLPLAWDGKPIPFWLYKLHGLGVEFQCEICGNAVYKGRRQFEKHFSEAFHTHNLAKLGITSNYPLFREITSMDEAKKLWAKIVQRREEYEAKLVDIEEMEDSEGNVISAAMYRDLEKAGML